MTTETELTPDEQLAHRIDYLKERGILECPSWCLQLWDEDQWEIHWGPWVPVLENAGDDRDVTVWARPARGWWDTNEDVNAPDLSFIDIAMTAHPPTGSDPQPPPADMTMLSHLGHEDLTELIAGLDLVREQAELSAAGVEWVWAYPGAEDDAEDTDEDDEDDEVEGDD